MMMSQTCNIQIVHAQSITFPAIYSFGVNSENIGGGLFKDDLGFFRQFVYM